MKFRVCIKFCVAAAAAAVAMEIQILIVAVRFDRHVPLLAPSSGRCMQIAKSVRDL